MPDAGKAVVVDGIRKSFGSVVALSDVSFEVGRGEVIGLLGPNGAGKTTMVDILSTLTRPDRGRAEVAGHDVVSDPAGVRRSIMLTGQQVALDDMLTGRENLVMFGRLQGLKKAAARERAKELLDQFDLVRRGGPERQHVFRRHASAHRHRLRIGGPPRRGVPRRADDRTGPAQPAKCLGPGVRIQAVRNRDAVDDPIPRGGRRAQ